MECPTEDGIDLVEPPVQAHGAVLHDAAFGLEEEQVVEVEVGTGVTHVFACERPLLERGAPVDAAMGRLVVLALDPGPEASVALAGMRGSERGYGEIRIPTVTGSRGGQLRPPGQPNLTRERTRPVGK